MINCREYADKWQEEIKEKLDNLNKKPCLVVVQIGDDKASDSYMKGIKKSCEKIGIECSTRNIEKCSYEEVIRGIREIEHFTRATALLLLTPLPYSKEETALILKSIPKHLDIDCLNPNNNTYKPCTPKGVMKLLEMMEVDLKGKVVTVLGRSENVGKPLVNMLIDKGATVVSCNSHTQDMSDWTLQSDIIVSAVGKSHFIKKNSIWADTDDEIKQIIIDIGINFDDNGKICGDCDKELYDLVDLITPVPNGISLMTRMALLDNVIESARI